MKRREFILSAAAATVGMIMPSAFAERQDQVLATLPMFTFARLRYASGNWDTDASMPAALYRSLSQHTRLRTDTREHVVGLDSDELFAFPFAYLTGNSLVKFTDRERENFARYLHDGGFIFVDDCNHDIRGTFAVTFETEMASLFAVPEQLHRLKRGDQLYRTFFDFSAGLPTTRHELNSWGDGQVHDYLRAVSLRNRMALLYSNKDFGCEWNDAADSPTPELEESMKLGVNVIVHALTKRQQG
jgi:hypothetical protein